MKKFFVLAATALALLACVKPEELPVVDPEVNGDGAIAFSVYAPKAVGTRAGIPGDVTNANIGGYGFGVFAYYTAGEKYDANAKPNFMYNQKVTKGDGTDAKWTYEPVKYWPNEYGNAAVSDEVDYVTFFAYAPWTDIEPTTGEIVPPTSTDPKVIEKAQKFNIISVNKNNATGDPIIKYVVDTDHATSVDILWGVAAADAEGNYTPIKTDYDNPVKAGKPFIDLVKPGNPKNDKISFNLKHSLAKVKFTIDYIADDFTPNGEAGTGTLGNKIDSTVTRIFVRAFTVSGWATKGALNLNNTTAGQPLWKDYDGVKDLTFNDLTFNDGRKDSKEGDVNGTQSNEENQGLNPKIIENWAEAKTIAATTTEPAKTVFGDKKNIGVAFYPQLLFGGKEDANGGYFYIIPRNEPGNSVDVQIVYDVETIDPKLAATLSDGELHGVSIENVISKKAILGPGKDFEAGKQYLVKIHIGMTSVKVEAVVTDWVNTNEEEVDLPDNQPMPCWTVEGVPGYFLTDPTEGIEVPVTFVTDSASFVKALEAGPWAEYYRVCDYGNFNNDGKYTRYTEWPTPFSLAGADRYNYAQRLPSPDGVVKTPAQWEAEGFVRCWSGVKTHSPSRWPQFGIDLGANVLPNNADAKCEIKYGNSDWITCFTGTWYANKMENNEPFVVGCLSEELGISSIKMNADFTAAEGFDAAQFKARYVFPSALVHKHETKY